MDPKKLTLSLTTALALAYILVPFRTTAQVQPVHEQGYRSSTSGCKEVVCTVAGDAGVLGVAPISYVTANDASFALNDAGGVDNDASFRVVGDGGSGSMFNTGSRWVSTVGTDNPVRVNNGAACNAFTGGVGRILNEGSVLDWTMLNTPDGGAPLFWCCAKSGTVVWQVCPLK